MSNCKNRCTGDCCRVFSFGKNIDKLNAIATEFKDGMQVAQMVIPLKVTGITGSGEIRHMYTCRNYWNGECGIYESRPDMCRIHADEIENSVCANVGCSIKSTCENHIECTEHAHDQTFSNAMQTSVFIRYSMFAWSKLLRTLVRYGAIT